MSTENVTRIWSAAADGRSRDLRYRQKQLRCLKDWVTRRANDLIQAIRQDLRYTREEAEYVLARTLGELREHYDKLNLQEELEVEYSIKKSQTCTGRRVAVGIAYIIPEKTTLVYSVLSALCAAIDAGNCCIIELANDLNITSRLLRQCLAEALDTDAFTITVLRLDKSLLCKCLVVDQTGTWEPADPRSKALLSAPSLRTVAIVDRSSDLEHAARQIVLARSAFRGKSPYVPDCVLVNEFVEKAFMKAMSQEISEVPAFKLDASKTEVAHNHYHRTTQSEIISENGAIQSVVRARNRNDSLLHQKTTRGVLPIQSFSSLDDAIDTVTQSTEALLALYIFAAPASAKYVAQFIPAAATFVNYIPKNMLTSVGPVSPLHMQVSNDLRYTRAMFETPSPQYMRPLAGGKDIATALLGINPTHADGYYQEAFKPLKPTGQREPGDKNFFVQAMAFASLVYILPVLSISLTAAVWTGLKLYTRFL